MNRPLRLATFAVPLSGNKGSASMLFGLRDAFAAADVAVRFEVFSYYPQRDQNVAEDYDNVSVHPGHPKDILFKLLPMLVMGPLVRPLLPVRWKRAVEALRRCDGVLLIGGTTFADSMLYKVPWNMLAALPGYWLRKPTLMLSQTLGPFRKRLNRAAARWTLRRAAIIHGRGRQSARWTRDLRIGRCEYRPDLSFSLKVPHFADVADRSQVVGRLRDKLAATACPAIGVTPNTIVYNKAKRVGRDYVGLLVSAVREIHRLGYLPTLIPHSYRGDDTMLHNNDRALCLAVLEKLPPDVDCYYVDADLPAEDLRALIGQMHVLVASRFHSMVSALAMGVPPITYGWGDHKYREVLAEFDVDELYIPYDELDESAFERKLETALELREKLSQRIRDALAEIKAHSQSLPREIAALLGPVPEVEADKFPHDTHMPSVPEPTTSSRRKVLH